MPTSTPPRTVTADAPHWSLLVILAGLGMVGPFSTNAVFPAFTSLGGEWGVSTLALQQIITVYLLAFAVISLFHGPVSDALGRRKVVIAGSIVYIASSVGCALAPDLTVLLVFRALQGFSAGAGQIISRAVVRDVFEGHRAQRAMAQIAMIFGLAPATAPIVGGWLLGVGDWRGVFWFLAGFGGLLLLLVLLWLPETHPPSARTPFSTRALFGNLWQVWAARDGRRLALTGMFHFGGYFLYISAAPLFIVGLLAKGEQDFWILYVPLIAGMVCGSWLSGRLAGRTSGRRLATAGYLLSAAGAAANLALALVPTTRGLPWAVLTLPLLSFGMSIAFPVVTLAMLDLYPGRTGAASSVQSFVSMVANAVIAGVLAPLLAGALWSLALGALSFVVVSWAMWMRHLKVTGHEPPATPYAPAYEPTDEL